MTRVKICGITNQVDAEKAASLNVDFLGIIFTKESSRFTDVDRAKKIRQEVKSKRTRVVGVFKNQAADEVNRIADLVDLDLIQLHGAESKEYIYKIERPVIKVLEYRDSITNIENAIDYRYCSHLLLDKPKEQNRQLNEKIDYSTLKELVSRLKPEFERVFLAGGITADSAEKIVQDIDPYGIDVCSGIEKETGVKDHKLMDKLVRNINSKG